MIGQRDLRLCWREVELMLLLSGAGERRDVKGRGGGEVDRGRDVVDFIDRGIIEECREIGIAVGSYIGGDVIAGGWSCDQCVAVDIIIAVAVLKIVDTFSVWRQAKMSAEGVVFIAVIRA